MSKDEFCEYIRMYEKAMYFYALSIVKNESDAADVVSDAIYQAYVNRDTLRNSNAFKSWVLRIVHNSAAQWIRKNNRLVFCEQVEDAKQVYYDQDVASKLSLQEAIRLLKQPYQSIIYLYYYEQLSILEIAKITNTNIVTLRKQLSRARAMLKHVLKKEMEV